ncbi:MAG TPA: hypothetical protein VLB44_22395, partial [Kofleriaceae bacterium]|nr:hypothetical protein [Kofleriaceae bacterium]
DAQRESIVAFESSLATAQESDNGAGSLNTGGATGGAEAIASQDFYIGINDNFGDYQTGAPFDAHVFDLYDSWANNQTAARRAIQRGQEIFNTRTFTIAGVAGLNGMTLPHASGPLPASFTGTCTTCHNAPNAGDHSIAAPLNIGIADESRRTPDMPLYTLKCTATGQVFKVTDPGRALISGKCADIGKFKGPILRGLASRAPYFHNGSAASLEDAIEFYNSRFNIGLTSQEKSDLAAFLATL